MNNRELNLPADPVELNKCLKFMVNEFYKERPDETVRAFTKHMEIQGAFNG